MALESLREPTAEVVHPLLCEAQWQREVVRACIHFEYYFPRSEGKRKKVLHLWPYNKNSLVKRRVGLLLLSSYFRILSCMSKHP